VWIVLREHPKPRPNRTIAGCDNHEVKPQHPRKRYFNARHLRPSLRHHPQDVGYLSVPAGTMVWASVNIDPLMAHPLGNACTSSSHDLDAPGAVSTARDPTTSPRPPARRRKADGRVFDPNTSRWLPAGLDGHHSRLRRR
jgi:hypothetical protein